MSPAVSQLVEVGVHLVHHGDFAFADGDSHEEGSPNEEHGCTELSHRCACHSSAPLLLQPPVSLHQSGEIAPLRAFFPSDEVTGLDEPEPPLRPPIASMA